MNRAEQFHLKVLNELSIYTTDKVDKYFVKLFMGDKKDQDYWREVYRQYDYPCYYYQYLACAVRVLKAKQVFEIGADRGTSALMMASEGAKVLSLDIRDGWEHGDHKNITKYIRDSLLVPDVDLKKTDLWLIDGLHTTERVSKELSAYQPYFKKGSIILLDDISEYKPIWTTINADTDKFLSYDIHGGGVGVIVV